MSDKHAGDGKVDYSFAMPNEDTVSVHASGDQAAIIEENRVDVENGAQAGMRLRPKEENKDDAGDSTATDPDDASATAEPQDEGEGGEGEAGTLTSPEAFTADDPENVAAWNKEYAREDGSLNLERFQKAVSANMAKEGGKPELSDNEYAYLKSRGISRADADTYISDRLNALAYQQTQHAKEDAEVFTTAAGVLDTTLDGAAILQEALAWGKEGYSEAQKDLYEKALDAGGEERKAAVELLLSRYGKTDHFKTAEAKRKQAKQEASRKTSPQRDVTKVGVNATNHVKPFASRQEWREARRNAGDDRAALALINKRAEASGY